MLLAQLLQSEGLAFWVVAEQPTTVQLGTDCTNCVVRRTGGRKSQAMDTGSRLGRSAGFPECGR
jgi:hypothetical protein